MRSSLVRFGFFVSLPVLLLLAGCGAVYWGTLIFILTQKSGDTIDNTRVDVFISDASGPSNGAATGETQVAVTIVSGRIAPAIDFQSPNDVVTRIDFPTQTRGVSISGAGAATNMAIGAGGTVFFDADGDGERDDTEGLVGTELRISINGEPAQSILFPSVAASDLAGQRFLAESTVPPRALSTGARIASFIERTVRVMAPALRANADAYAGFTAHFDEEAGVYVLRTGASGATSADFTITVVRDDPTAPTFDDAAPGFQLGIIAGEEGPGRELSEVREFGFAIADRGDKAATGVDVNVFLSRNKTLEADQDLLVRQFADVAVGVGETRVLGFVPRADFAAASALPAPISARSFLAAGATTSQIDGFFFVLVQADVDGDNGPDNDFVVAPEPIQIYDAGTAAVSSSTDLDFVISQVRTQTAGLLGDRVTVNFALSNLFTVPAADPAARIELYISNDRKLDLPANPLAPNRLTEDVPLVTFSLSTAVTNGSDDSTIFIVAGAGTLAVGDTLVIGGLGRDVATFTRDTPVAGVDRIQVGTAFPLGTVTTGATAQVLRLSTRLTFSLGQDEFTTVGDLVFRTVQAILPAEAALPVENVANDPRTFFIFLRILPEVAESAINNVRVASNFIRVYRADQAVLLGSVAFPRTTAGDPTPLAAVLSQKAGGNVIRKEEQRLLSFEIPDEPAVANDASQVFVSVEAGDFDPQIEIISNGGAQFGVTDDSPVGRPAVLFQALEGQSGNRTFFLVVSPSDPASADVNANGSAFQVAISVNPLQTATDVLVEPINLGDVFRIPSGNGSDDSFATEDAVGNAFRVFRRALPVSLPQRQRQFLFFVPQRAKFRLRVSPAFTRPVTTQLVFNGEGSGQLQLIQPVAVQDGPDTLFLFDPPSFTEFKEFQRGSMILSFESNEVILDEVTATLDFVFQPERNLAGELIAAQ